MGDHHMGGQGMRLADILAVPESSIRECLTVFDKHGVSSVFVVDDSGHLLGVVAERDIRKALVGGASLESSVRDLVGVAPVTVRPSDDRAAALDLMQALELTELPVVDSHGRLLGMHAEQEVVGGPILANWAVVS